MCLVEVLILGGFLTLCYFTFKWLWPKRAYGEND